MVGAFIRLWRQHRGLTLKALALQCGWTEVHQCRLELHQTPDADEMRLIAAGLDVDVTQLYSAPPDLAEASAS